MNLDMFEMCEHPEGCRKVATYKITVVEESSGNVRETRYVCAYCADGVSAPDGYRIKQSKIDAAEYGRQRQ